MGTIAACAAFAACCGSSPASAATMGTVALPGMRHYGYSDELATGCVAAGGSLGILIPPSVIFVIYGILTEQSIAKLFIAGVIPGIVLSLLFIAAIFVVTTIHPEMGPAGEATTWRQKLQSLLGGVGETIFIFALIMGGLFIGVFTPSEAGAVGAAAISLIALTTRSIGWQTFYIALGETIKTTAMILLIIAGATVFGHFLATTRLPFVAAEWVAGLALPRSLIMLCMVGVYLLGGCVMDGMALIMLTTPIFFPVIIALGYDPIWFGVIVVLIIEMAVITPPVGINVFVIKGIAKDVPLETIFKGIVPFLLAEILMVIILLIWPEIALYLPNLMT
jgi:C4-dicarboxylate transporter DctM subunit